MLRGDALHMAAGHQCSSGAQEAVRPLIAFGCATLVGYTDQVPEMITFLGFFKASKWTFLDCYNHLS